MATLEEILAAERPHILRRWLDVVLALHAPETARFLEDERDPFANPVGEIMRQATVVLYDRLCQPTTSAACPPLEQLMRLRAVHESTPSRAVEFLLALKRLLRADLCARHCGQVAHADLVALEDRIDQLTLQAVDLFVAYREQLSVLRVNEARRGTEKLLERLRREDAEPEDP